MKLFGEYNRNGYQIFDAENPSSDPVYQAGNCQYDSAQYLPIGSDGTISLESIMEYCNSTGKDLAEEHNCKWLGCAPIDDFEPAESEE